MHILQPEAESGGLGGGGIAGIVIAVIIALIAVAVAAALVVIIYYYKRKGNGVAELNCHRMLCELCYFSCFAQVASVVYSLPIDLD